MKTDIYIHLHSYSGIQRHLRLTFRSMMSKAWSEPAGFTIPKQVLGKFVLMKEESSVSKNGGRYTTSPRPFSPTKLALTLAVVVANIFLCPNADAKTFSLDIYRHTLLRHDILTGST